METNCYLIAKMISTVDVFPAVSSLGMFLAESQGHSNHGKAKKINLKNAHCLACFYKVRIQSLLNAMNYANSN